MSPEVRLLCRICTNPSDDSTMFRLFDEMDNPVALAEIFLHVSGITVQAEDYKLPKHCCQCCKNRLREVEDLRNLCQKSDRKLREMIGIEVKEEEEEECAEQNANDVDAIPKVELLELEESYSQWDDTENRLDSDYGHSESDDDKPLKSRKSAREKSESKHKADDEEEAGFSDDSDEDPDFVAELDIKKTDRKNRGEEISPEPKIAKKRGRKPKIRDPELEAQPKVLKKRGPKPKIRDPNADPVEKKERKKKEKKEKVQESFCCITCGKVYKSLFALREHETSHSTEKRWKCEICSLEFARRNNFRVHVKRHQTEGKFKCSECEKAFHLEKLLNQHVQTRHRNERPHHCKTCEKSYKSASALLMHIRTIHKGIKKMKCDICLRQFVYKYGYDRHMNSHKGIKLNQCPHCGNKYEFRAYLLQHIAEKHPETVENLTRCQYCGLGYSTDGYYRKHIIKRHPEHLEEFDRVMKAKRESGTQPNNTDVANEVTSSSQNPVESFPEKIRTNTDTLFKGIALSDVDNIDY